MNSKNSFKILIALLTFFYITHSCLNSYQYYDQNSQCQPCYYKCLTCSDGTQYCDSCITQYYLDNNYLCQSCFSGCATCTNSSVCLLCNDGFYINNNGTCSLCPLGSKTCTISIISSCLSNYYMLSQICVGCLQNCSVCTDSNSCQTCVTGNFLFNSSYCMVCGNNCLVCQNSSTCTTCNIGYYPSTQNNACIICPGVGNLIYSTANNTCITCAKYCQMCDQNACYYCNQGYILSNDSSSCIQGGSILCYQSTDYGYQSCQTSKNGCPLNTVQQYDTSSGSSVPLSICLPKSFTYTSQFIYDNINTGCNSINLTTYAFNTKSNYGVNLIIQLFIFSPVPNNFTLVSGTFNQTISIPSNISSQPLINSTCGQYVIWNFYQTLNMSSNSISLKGNISINQIYIEALLCSVTKCKRCTTNLDCVSCISPYLLQLNQCVLQCNTGFYYYSGNSTCYLSCPETTYPIQSEYQCYDCNKNNCYTCSSIAVCLSCNKDYYLYNGTCVTDCSSITNKYFYSNNTTLVCTACPFPCLTCVLNNSNTYCYSCQTGYLYNNSCIFECPIGTYISFNINLICSSCNNTSPYFCLECSINSSTCVSCILGYTLINNVCQLSCPSGYFNLSGICRSCLFPCKQCSTSQTNCSSCTVGSLQIMNNTGICKSNCSVGYFSNSSNTQNVICSKCNVACVTCFGSNNGSCYSCAVNYFLSGTNCLSSCSLNTTYSNSNLNICSPCIQPCLTCQNLNGSACTSCVIAFLNSTQCTLSCNSSSFPYLNNTIYICTLCPTNCLSCTSENICTSCISPYELYLNKNCINASNCPIQFYNDTVNLYCLPCNSPCLTCNNSGVRCLSCISNYYYIIQYNNCVSNCPKGYYSIDAYNCANCNSNCSTCYGQSNNCTSCSHINSTIYYFYNNTCLIICPSRYYANITNYACANCVSPCNQCYNFYYCISCVNNSFVLYDKSCINTCPTRTINIFNTTLQTYVCENCINNCNECQNNISNCINCLPKYYLYFNVTSNSNSCLSNCPTYYYSDIYSSTCLICTSPCLTCNSFSSCFTCINSYNLFNNQCLLNCPVTYFSLNQICNKCISPCENCFDNITCTLCVQGYFMPYNQQNTTNCLKNCPIGFYPDSFNRICSKCAPNCLNCLNNSICYSCGSNTYLYMNNCFSNCPSGYFMDNSNNVCTKCANNCLICNTLINCSSCSNNYYLYNFSCYVNCPAATYNSINMLSNMYICVNCQNNCISCTSYYTCINCSNNYILQSGSCKSSCQIYYYLSNNQCLHCPSNCITCTNITFCLSCQSSYLYQNLCYTSCPNNTYPIQKTTSCGKCVSPCLNCINQYQCLSCQKNYILYESNCLKSCPSNIWYIVNNNTCNINCDAYKDYSNYYCYKTCPKYKVSYENSCLSSCPKNTYVSNQQNCLPCTSEICSFYFNANLQLLTVNGFQIILYFNQRSQITTLDDISITFTSLNTNRRLDTLQLLSYEISDRLIKFNYNITQIRFTSITIKLPYLKSQETSQSLIQNTFKKNIDVYQSWNGIPNFIILSILLSIMILIIFLINVLFGSGHYQQIMELGQFFFILNYLEISYPYQLSTFYEGFKLIMFALPKDLFGAPYIYSFSPSKFIYYSTDNNFIRNCSFSIILVMIAVIIATFLAVYLYLKREIKYEQANQFIRICIEIRKRIFWRYLNDFFYVGILWNGIYACSTFINPPNIHTKFTYALGSITIIIICISVIYLFYLVLKNLQTKKRNLDSIEGLVEDLQTDTSVLGLMHTPIVYLRKLLIIFLVGIYSNQPIYSLCLILAISCLILAILIFYKPFKNNITDYISIMIEFCIVLTILLIIILKINQTSFNKNTKIGIGYFLLVLDSICLVIGVSWWSWITFKQHLWKYFCKTSVSQQYEQKNKQQSKNLMMNKQNKGSLKSIKIPGVQIIDFNSDNQNKQYGNVSVMQENQIQMSHEQEKMNEIEQFKHYGSQSEQNNQNENTRKVWPNLLLKKQNASNIVMIQ